MNDENNLVIKITGQLKTKCNCIIKTTEPGAYTMKIRTVFLGKRFSIMEHSSSC